MKKFTLILAFFCLIGQNFAQSPQGDIGLIPVTAFVPKQIDAMSSTAQKNLENKISQMVAASGMSSLSYSKFAIIPKVIVVDKQTQASTPPMIVMNLEITYYFGNVDSGDVFGSLTKNYKGVGQNDTKAYMAAINAIKPKDAEMVEFLETGKQKILDYYDKIADKIIQTAQKDADMGNYDAALLALSEIPMACNSYSKCMDAAFAIYQKKIDVEGTRLYNEAYALWNSQQNYEGAESACNILAKIHPLSASASQAKTLSDNIGKRVREIDNREWNFKLQQQQNEVDLQKAVIKATAEVAKAEANRPVYNYNVVWW